MQHAMKFTTLRRCYVMLCLVDTVSMQHQHRATIYAPTMLSTPIEVLSVTDVKG